MQPLLLHPRSIHQKRLGWNKEDEETHQQHQQTHLEKSNHAAVVAQAEVAREAAPPAAAAAAADAALSRLLLLFLLHLAPLLGLVSLLVRGGAPSLINYQGQSLMTLLLHLQQKRAPRLYHLLLGDRLLLLLELLPLALLLLVRGQVKATVSDCCASLLLWLYSLPLLLRTLREALLQQQQKQQRQQTFLLLQQVHCVLMETLLVLLCLLLLVQQRAASVLGRETDGPMGRTEGLPRHPRVPLAHPCLRRDLLYTRAHALMPRGVLVREDRRL